MSRIGRKPIPVPAGVDVKIDGQTVTVKGPKGELQHTVAEPITVERGDDGALYVVRPNDERKAKELHGLSRTLVANMVVGVTEGYRKSPGDRRHRLPRAAKGTDLEFALGFSHPVVVAAPDGITFTVERPTLFHVGGHRQAAGRRGRREHPQDPSAGAVQGQGRQVPGRGHSP